MNTVTFAGTGYTRKSLFDLKGSDLVALHNKLASKAKVAETKRFSSIGAGVERTWKLLEQVGSPAAAAAKPEKAPAPKVDPLTPSMGTPVSKLPKVKAEKPAGGRRGTNLAAPGFAPLACRQASKQAILVDKLSSSKGATMEELLEALSGGNKPWTESSVRAGFGWDMKQKGYGVRSETGADGVERFFIVVPTGHSIPAHTPLKSVPKAPADQGRLKV